MAIEVSMITWVSALIGLVFAIVILLVFDNLQIPISIIVKLFFCAALTVFGGIIGMGIDKS